VAMISIPIARSRTYHDRILTPLTYED